MADFPNNEDLNKEDPLEQLLDSESDEEFGLPEFREHFADSLTPAVLKDWTAKDFASIYVRFRPHLERHARRFLVNPSQVDEVVQDAFLYLMTTLPELDSEVGVLKFLKWKTRLLALDVIRSNSRASFAPIDEQPEFAADLPEMSSELERAEDAAIVSLALAKLQPRHREALVATIYEEKSTEVVAAQMGLSENAFRQLLFRARSSFKKALIGEAETAGLSLGQILTVAARKAAAESGKYISAAGAFLLVLAIAIGVVPNLSGGITENSVALPEPTTTSQPQVTSPEAPVVEEEGATEEVSTEVASEESLVEQVSTGYVQGSPGVSPQIQPAISVTPKPSALSDQEVDEERAVLEGFLKETLNKTALASLGSSDLGVVLDSPKNTAGTLTITNKSGLTANVAYDLSTQTGIQHTWFSIEIDGNNFMAVPKASYAEKTQNPDGSYNLYYVATDLLIGDNTGNFDFIAIDDTEVSRGALRIELKLDADGSVLSSKLSLTARS